MIRPLLFAVLFASSCHHEKPTTTPPGETGGDTTEKPVVPSSDPTGNECVARCLESDAHKDVTVDEREGLCRADCPATETAPPEGETPPEAAAEG